MRKAIAGNGARNRSIGFHDVRPFRRGDARLAFILVCFVPIVTRTLGFHDINDVEIPCFQEDRCFYKMERS
jgi:hypothetical protein